MPNIGPFELLIILFLALIILGPSRLPDLANALGRSIREFRKASSDVEDAVSPRPASSTAPLPPNTLSTPLEPNTLAGSTGTEPRPAAPGEEPSGPAT